MTRLKSLQATKRHLALSVLCCLSVVSWDADAECRDADVECWDADVECWDADAECWDADAECWDLMQAAGM